ncbi:HAMP domain-containing sensor histidine kinase [Photobacterium sp. OFAV2-7]|uniref:sensor histidine kinase n=1 Tax=Photobacterium sp. OFAV2-7 TaxID=2917748 RepID=UPI001EF6D150|nr:HAMP domain-containing sensor histidine kinase [Photobacterium sp. OFAV2-7]MCG7585773.1 HAMP domain-containing histidine kinase [Photobacterium sp. OFAV2-7]
MPSIKREVYKLLGGFVVLLILLFASLMFINVKYGISTDTKNMLVYQGALLEQSYKSTGSLPSLVNSEILSVYKEVEDIPAYIADGFPWPEMEVASLEEKPLYDDLGKARYVYAMKYTIKGLSTPIYIISSYDDDLEKKIQYEASIREGNLFYIALGIGMIILTILLFVKVLYWRLLSPVETLFDWVNSLDEENTPSSKRLKYIELVQLVEELKNNIIKQKEFIDREGFFLRTISHELRTPIAIISTSGELLERLSLRDAIAQRATDRIMYAVDNMKTLVQTLLWISRKSDCPLPVTEIDIQAMIRGLVEDNKYLSQDKDIEFNLDKLATGDVILDNYGTVHLVLINLIRNAIQYTHQGCITFESHLHTVTITNPVHEDIYDQKVESSYGIGLYLVEKICEAQNYSFEIMTETNTVRARVSFIP